jgi:hypothetical protein
MIERERAMVPGWHGPAGRRTHNSSSASGKSPERYRDNLCALYYLLRVVKQLEREAPSSHGDEALPQLRSADRSDAEGDEEMAKGSRVESTRDG